MNDDSAGFVSRLLALAVDVALLGATLAGLGWFAHAIETSLRNQAFLHIAPPAILGTVLRVAIVVAYFVFSWFVFGQTPGKWLLGLRVVGPDGEPPSFARSVLRLFGYTVSAAPLYLGFLWVLFDKQRRGFHDLLARTRVVYADRRAPSGDLKSGVQWRPHRSW